MATVRQIINKAGIEISVAPIGGSFDLIEESYILERLQDLLDSLTLKGWVWPARGYEVVDFSPSAAGKRFTVGPAADGRAIEVTRIPLRIHAIVQDQMPLVQMDLLSILKEGGSEVVSHFFYELVSDSSDALNYGTAQYGRVHFNRPAATTDNFELYFQQSLMIGGPVTATDNLLLPFGYERFLVFLLANELLDTYGVTGDRASRIERAVTAMMSDIMEQNKDLYTGHMDNMLKTTVPGTDAMLKGNSPVVGVPINRQRGQ